MLLFLILMFLLEIRALHDLLQPGPEPAAGEPDMLPGQFVEDDNDLLVSLSTAPQR